MSWKFRAWRAFAAASVVAWAACAQVPSRPPRFGSDAREASLAQARAEARAIEAAKRHPNAIPRVRSQYPEQSPPPLPAGQSLPPPIYVTRRAPSAAQLAAAPTVVERDVYVQPPARPRYGLGVGFGYGYPYPYWSRSLWAPYGYGRYGYPYGFGYQSGYGVGIGAWWRPSHHHAGFGLGRRPGRLHLGRGFGFHGHGGGAHALHIRNVHVRH